jgi:hypothetical protein
MPMTFPTTSIKDDRPEPAPQAVQETLSTAATAVLDVGAARRKIAEYKVELDRIQGLADALVVDDEVTAKKAVEIGLHAKKFVKQIEDTRKAIVAEPTEFTRKVNSFVKPFRDAGDRIERTCKQKHSSYLYRKELERREQEKKAQDAAKELQAKLDAEAKEKGVESVTIPDLVVNQTEPTVTRLDEGGSGSIRKEWKLKEVADFAQVPDQYKQLNEQAVKAAIKAGVRDIPGLVIGEVPVSVFRS